MDTNLIVACRTYNVEDVKRLLKYTNSLIRSTNNVEIPHRDDNGMTPLHLVTHHNSRSSKYVEKRAEIVKRLLLSNSSDIENRIFTDISCRDRYGNTSLHYAVQCGDIYIISLLLNDGADVLSRDYDGKTPLHISLESDNNVYIVKLLLNKGADVLIVDDDGKTSLHYAARNVKLNMIEPLLKSIYINEKNVQSTSVPYTLQSKICISDNAGKIPLHYAAMYNNVEVVEVLLKCGSDICTKDNKGKTPLHCAVSDTENVDNVRLLLKYRADVSAKDNKGKTPLHYAVSINGNINIVELLLKHIIISFTQEEALNIVSIKDNHGKTPLHISCHIRDGTNVSYYDDIEIVKSLLNMGASVNNECNNLTTPLICASDANINVDIVKLLLESGANVSHVTEDGLESLDYVSYDIDGNIYKLLTKWKGNISNITVDG